MSVDTEKFPKHYDFDPDLWEDEGEWRKYMTLLYTGKEIRDKNETSKGDSSG